MPLRLGFQKPQAVGGLPVSLRKRFELADMWVNQAGLITKNGVVLTNVTRATATPPPSGNAYLSDTGGGSYVSYLVLYFPPGTVVMSSCYVYNNSGGGTALRVTVQSGSQFHGNSGGASWVPSGPIVATVGTDGLWTLEGLYEYHWADMLIYAVLPG